MALLGPLAVFMIVSAFQLIRCQPNSPCPRIFHYIYNGEEWQGAIEVTSPPMGVTVNLAVVLLVPQKIATENLGSLGLWKNREDTLRRIAHHQAVRYRVKFPPHTPIPRVSSIIYNGHRICTNKPNYIEGLLMTQIRLEHTLYTKLAKERFSAGENHDKITKADPQVILQNRFDDTDNECGKIHDKFTVTNLMMFGNEMQRGSWPWLVALHAYKTTNLSFICGGTLISERIILSAAHCLHNRDDYLYAASDVIAFLGKHNLRKLTEKDVVISEISSIHIHPDFLRNNGGAFDADIAVLVMRDPVEYQKFIQPACLSRSSILPAGRLGVIVGWGRDEHNNILTFEPRRLEIPIVSETECLAAGKIFSIITTPRTFCGGWRDGKRGPCHGDSGSGLLIYEDHRWQLLGIISVAVKHPISGLCDLSQYVVFTDVSKFVQWIEQF
ncbi:serine protease gd-like [Phlebotomus argentipes]|uniref:serine protease gd-like n=1 Tax=Phlebotomus argentipes TaxID=94469 RepID=UPI00289348CB|nr:serine protease gd-like [Phlebotomus argentipes]